MFHNIHLLLENSVIYNFCGFSKCKELCSYAPNPVSEHLPHPQKFPCAHQQGPASSPNPRRTLSLNLELFFCCYDGIAACIFCTCFLCQTFPKAVFTLWTVTTQQMVTSLRCVMIRIEQNLPECIIGIKGIYCFLRLCLCVGVFSL